MSNTAFGYARVSTISQVTDGDGLGVQRERIAAWCAYQGATLAALHEDAGVSGSVTDRPGLRAALRAVLEAGPGATLVVYKLDRLGRDALHVQETIAVLLDAGVRLVAIADGVDSASGLGGALLRVLTSLLASFAEVEKENITTRLRDGRARAKSQGKRYSRESAYGLEPGEGATVERIRALRAQGLTYAAICAALDAEGIRPRRAASWSPIVVQRIATGRRTPRKPKPSERVARARAEIMGAA